MSTTPVAPTKIASPGFAPSRESRVGRIARGAVAVTLMITMLAIATNILRTRFVHVGFPTGYLLIGLVFFLAAYNLRKRFPAIPLFRSATWLRLHLDAGFLVIGVFLIHINWRIPDGIFERTIAGLFVGTVASGLYGLYATLTIPPKLSGLRMEVIFEQIPKLRRQIASEARALVLSKKDDAAVLAQAYETSVGPFLNASRNLAYYLYPTGNRRRQLVAALRDLHRYLSDELRQDCQRLELLVCQKDDLDYHTAMQGRLKVWLFIHIGLTYSLIVGSIWHMVLAHAFHGGPR